MAGQKRKSSSNSRQEELQLMAMRKDDSSWHPCKISLCSDRVGLKVDYMQNGFNAVILTKEEALAQLRICSNLLQAEECTLIGQGERVLANPKSEANAIFFEAEVEKRINVRHSRKLCRCNFVVRWNCYGSKGETAVLPLYAIMKISAKCIDAHPTIAEFFNIVAIPVCNSSLLSTPVQGAKDREGDLFKLEYEGSDCELDSSELEKQIDSISKSVAVSEMKSSEKIAFGILADDNWRALDNSSTTYSSISVSHFSNQMKEKGLKSSQTPPIIKEESLKTRSPISLQAAVAYFALEKAKLSESAECSPTLKEVKVFKPQLLFSEISKGSSPCNVSLMKGSYGVDNYSARTEAAGKYVLKNKNIVKKLFPIKEATNDHIDESCDASGLAAGENLKFEPEIANDISNTASSATNNKTKKPSCSSRQKRSQSSCEVMEKTCITKSNSIPSPRSTRRLTSSAIREAESNKINNGRPSSILGTDLLEDEEAVVSVGTAETASMPIEELKCEEGNRGMCDEKDTEKITCSEGRKTSDNSRRMTRSALRRLTENNHTEHSRQPHATRLYDNLKGKITSESKASRGAGQIASALCPSKTVERCNQVQTTASVEIAPKTEGDAPGDHANRSRGKRKSWTGKEEHLRPRTRSQCKS